MTNQYRPDHVEIPGETLLETLTERGMSQADLAERTGRPVKMINEIIKGKAPITSETALQLEKVLNVPARFWVDLERNYRTDLARIRENEALAQQVDWLDHFPLREMCKYGWIDKATDKVEQVRELLSYYGIASPQQWERYWAKIAVSYRRSQAFEWNDAALAAWLRKGELEAAHIECAPFDKEGFREALSQVRNLTLESEPDRFIPQVVNLCAGAGVAVVFVRELPKTRASGATRWLSSRKALIQLSLRHKTNDHLWFSFFHEAGHVLLHGKKELFVDAAKGGEGEQEEQANKFAADMLIPAPALRKFLVDCDGRMSAGAVRQFAGEIGIAPGIVVGRLQHDGVIPFGVLNGLKVGYEWG